MLRRVDLDFALTGSDDKKLDRALRRGNSCHRRSEEFSFWMPERRRTCHDGSYSSWSERSPSPSAPVVAHPTNQGSCVRYHLSSVPARLLYAVENMMRFGGTDSSLGKGPIAYSDEALIERVRSGEAEAFAVLHSRHEGVARHLAAGQTDNVQDVDDIVAEAFALVFQHLSGGKGPDSFFRAYLLTVVRRVAHDHNRSARRVHMTADLELFDGEHRDEDPIISTFVNEAMRDAFRSLPQRWQAVLWYLDVEGMKPSAASEFLGLRPNAVSSLAKRAREGLRKAYLAITSA